MEVMGPRRRQLENESEEAMVDFPSSTNRETITQESILKLGPEITKTRPSEMRQEDD